MHDHLPPSFRLSPGARRSGLLGLAFFLVAAPTLPACQDPACAPGCHLAGDGYCEPDTGDAGDGCTVDETAFPWIEAELSEVPTVVRVNWGTARSTESWIRYTDVDGDTRNAEAVAATRDHEAFLVGLPPRTEVTFRARTEEDGTSLCSEERTLTTGDFESSFPDPEVSVYEGDRVSGAAVTTPLFATGGQYLGVFDERGRMVWAARPQSRDLMYRTVFVPDGSGIVYGSPAYDEGDPGTLLCVGWDGSVQEEFSIPGMHHDLLALPDGGFATLSMEARTFDDGGDERTLLGDRILEFEVEDPGEGGTPELVEVWNAFDWFEPDLERTWPDYYEGWGDAEAWTYANSLSYDQAEDRYLLTLEGLGYVASVDRQTGDLQWVLSEEKGDFSWNEEQQPLVNPHRVRADADGELLALERGDWSEGSCSEAVRLNLDETAGTVERIWSHATEDCVQVRMLGDVHPLSDRGVLVTWSSAGRLEEITEAGEPVLRVELDMGTAFGFADRFPALFSASNGSSD